MIENGKNMLKNLSLKKHVSDVVNGELKNSLTIWVILQVPGESMNVKTGRLKPNHIS